MAESALPENIFYAAVAGDIDHIKNWLEQGGDPDRGLDREFHDDGVVYEQGSTLLMKDYMALLRVRSLLARGPRRARPGPETPEAVARLFGNVPDPCFWLVVEYAWLGNWRRP